MRRFAWPLQRLLDVTSQREDALRHALLEAARKILRQQQEIRLKQEAQERLIADLARQDLPDRMRNQPLFLEQAQRTAREIVEAQAQLVKLEQHKAELTRQYLHERSSRKTLDRLRDEALRRHAHQQSLAEQKQLDESFQVSFARKAIEGRRLGKTGA